MLHHLAGAIIQDANLVNQNDHLQEDGDKNYWRSVTWCAFVIKCFCGI